MAAEQLYHRYHARESDAVLALAPQVIFREQYRQLRAPGLIRDDIALALDVAAECADVLAIIRLLLALTEVNERTSALENVNMPALLYEAGRVDEAIAFWRRRDVGRPARAGLRLGCHNSGRPASPPAADCST